jgi:hypothetical protein
LTREAALVVVLSLVVASQGCTFPDVTYRSEGGGGTGGGCDVTSSKCLNDASGCRTQAGNKRDACLNPCMPNDDTCEEECQVDYDADLAICANECEGCVLDRQGCDATADCRDLVGL